MSMCHFWAQNGPFTQMKFFFPENLLIRLVHFIYAYHHAKNQSQVLIYQWNIYNKIMKADWLRASTWESDFSQACSLCRMLMNHKNFCFTQIPDKTDDVNFLKSSQTLFLGHFRPFLVIFAQWGFFFNWHSLHARLNSH